MKLLSSILLATLVSVSAEEPISSPDDPHGRYPSPDKNFVLVYRTYAPIQAGGEPTQGAKLLKGNEQLWSFLFRGSSLFFSWSPNSRYLLMHGSDANGKLALLYLDASTPKPIEHPLNADWVAQLVRARLTTLKNRDYWIHVGRIEWLAGEKCLPNFHLGSDPSAIVLSLDLDAAKPAFKELASK